MKDNFTAVAVVLDKSGSMNHIVGDTIGGFNQFLSDQKKVEGEAVLTLVTFNTDVTVVRDFQPLQDTPNLDPRSYVPSGSTALLDAIGTTINSLGARLAGMPEEERPSQVIFLIITDGEENSSREFKLDQIKSMVQHQQDVYGWTISFIGANIDSISTGQSLGIAGAASYSFAADAADTHQLYSDISDGVADARRTRGTFKMNRS